MMYRKIIPLAIMFVLGLGVIVFGQGGLPDLGIQPEKNLAVGIVKSIGEKGLVLETKDGMLDVAILSQTGFKRLPPDQLSLKAATESNFKEIAVGDRVLVTGKISADSKNIITKTVYLVKNADLKAIEEKEREEWTTRGISGRVTGVDVASKEITVEMRAITGAATTIKVTPKEEVKYLRYAPTSVKYQDAIESDISAVKVGDMLRALGDRSEDQTGFKAEQILTGAFVTVSGTVKSIDTEKNQVTITDLKTKKDVTIAVNSSSLLKKFPEETAQRLARMQMMARMRAAGITPPNSGRADGDGAQNDGKRRQPPTEDKKPGGDSSEAGRRPGGGAGRGGGMRGGGDINEMINRFPTITLVDLKVGDMIAASSPKGTDPSHLTAIKLLAGVEPFLTLPQIPAGRGGARNTSVGGSLSIPGLDGADF